MRYIYKFEESTMNGNILKKYLIIIIVVIVLVQLYKWLNRRNEGYDDQKSQNGLMYPATMRERVMYDPKTIGIGTNGENATGIKYRVDNKSMYDAYGLTVGSKDESDYVNALKKKGFKRSSDYGGNNKPVVEMFISKDMKKELAKDEEKCPFEYIKLTVVDGKYVVKSKLLNKKTEEPDDIYDNEIDFLAMWNTLSERFPDLEKCGNPYYKYKQDLDKKHRYDEQKAVERFIQVKKKVDDTNKNLAKYRTTTYISSQTQNFGSPETPVQAKNLPGSGTTELSFENSVLPTRKPASTNTYNDMVELTHNCNVHLLEKDAQIGDLNRQIDKLYRDLTRKQEEYTELDNEMKQQTDQIMYATNYNDIMQDEMKQKENRIQELQYLYDKVDTQKNTLEIQLQQIRKQMMSRGKKDGYIFTSPTDWTMPNSGSYPPLCVGGNECPAQPAVDNIDRINRAFANTGVAEWKSPPFVS